MSNFGINRGQAGLIGRLNAAGGAAEVPYVVATPPVFDGTNDYMTRGADFTGNADSKSGILSFWLRLDGGNGSAMFLLQNTGSWVRFQRNASNVFLLEGFNAAGSGILTLTSATAYTAAAAWLHIIMAWNLAAAAGQMIVNGASDLAGGATLTNDTIDYTRADWAVGASTAGASKFNGAMAEVYFAPGQYLDMSEAANVQKFRTSAGKPVDLGTDGSTPTGVAPILYLKSAYTAFNTNSGTGGNLSVTGTLTASATSPSD